MPAEKQYFCSPRPIVPPSESKAGLDSSGRCSSCQLANSHPMYLSLNGVGFLPPVYCLTYPSPRRPFSSQRVLFKGKAPDTVSPSSPVSGAFKGKRKAIGSVQAPPNRPSPCCGGGGRGQSRQRAGALPRGRDEGGFPYSGKAYRRTGLREAFTSSGRPIWALWGEWCM